MTKNKSVPAGHRRNQTDSTVKFNNQGKAENSEDAQYFMNGPLENEYGSVQSRLSQTGHH